jgi:hypothetical protein
MLSLLLLMRPLTNYFEFLETFLPQLTLLNDSDFFPHIKQELELMRTLIRLMNGRIENKQFGYFVCISSIKMFFFFNEIE